MMLNYSAFWQGLINICNFHEAAVRFTPKYFRWKEGVGRGERGDLMGHGGEASLMGVLGRVLRWCNIFKPHALLMSWLQLLLVVVLVLLRLPRLRYQYRLQLRAVPCATWVSRTTI